MYQYSEGCVYWRVVTGYIIGIGVALAFVTKFVYTSRARNRRMPLMLTIARQSPVQSRFAFALGRASGSETIEGPASFRDVGAFR